MLKNNKKRASLTIEIALGLVAAVVVLLLIIRTFNTNLNSMVNVNVTNSSNFKRLFNANNKTSYTGWDKDPTTNLVATAATQGEMTLADWQAQAMQKINALLADGEISESEKMDLARYLTEYAMANTPQGSYGGATAANGQKLETLQSDNGIGISQGMVKTTTVKVDGVTKKLNWEGSISTGVKQTDTVQNIVTATWS